MRVAVYSLAAGSGFGNKRARYVAEMMLRGLRRCGVRAEPVGRFRGVQADVAVAYGWVHESIFRAYAAAGAQYAFWDLGYFNRRPDGAPRDGHHRLAVNAWDTLDGMARFCDASRLARLGLRLGEHDPSDKREILVAGMSPKAAGTHGFRPGQWEAATAARLRALRLPYQVVERAKPRKGETAEPIRAALARTRVLVTHHSNCAVDAILAGVPVYCTKGVGRLASMPELTADTLARPTAPSVEERRAILADVAWAQWTPPEMASGEAWQHIRGLLK